MTPNASKVANKGGGAGKRKVVSSSGVKDARNDMMMYQIVEANRRAAAARAPHAAICLGFLLGGSFEGGSFYAAGLSRGASSPGARFAHGLKYDQ